LQNNNITRRALYEKLILRWLERNIAKLKNENIKEIGDLDAVEELLKHCEKLALELYQKG